MFQVTLPNGVTVVRPGEQFGIEPDIVSKGYTAEHSPTPVPITAIQPHDSQTVVVIGVVRNLTPESDPFKSFNLPNTSMARAMLGERWAKPVGKVTIHEPSAGTAQFHSYTAWAPSALLADVKEGIAASATFVSVAIPDQRLVWFCNRFEA